VEQVAVLLQEQVEPMEEQVLHGMTQYITLEVVAEDE
jgi:hypothetical protein